MKTSLLIAGLALSLAPAFADNGKIAFISSRSGNGDIFTMNPDGTGVTNLSNTASIQEGGARWRLDGGKIVYQRTDALWTMNADGSGQAVLSQGGAPVWPDFHPSGSPIIFSRPITSDYDVAKVNADGTGFAQILSNQYGDYYTRWSPDGTKFTFYTFFENFTPEVVVANANGSGQTRLTTAGNSQNASWSPDGSHIAFRSSRNGNNEIYVMNPDGSNQTRITNNSASDDLPSYSPDGTKIVFVSNRDGNNEIYVMNADGTNQTRITNNSADDSSPSWVIPIPAGSPTLNIADASVNEGDTGTTDLAFTVSLAAASTQAVTVNYRAFNGTATAPSDYTAQTGVLTFAPGETSKIINVAVQGDTVNEANEQLNVSLFGPTNAFLGDSTALGTILDNDPVPAISIADASHNEGNIGSSSFDFTLSLSTPSGRSATVNYSTANGSATQPSDYITSTGTATFAPGATEATVSVPVIGNSVREADETFLLNLSTPVNATIADGQATGTILNDDLPVISVTGSNVTEGDSGQTNVTFTVSLSEASPDDVSFDFATAPGTATADVDYVTTSGSRTILAGDTTKTINVAVNGDLINEPNETFFLVISNAVNAVVAPSLPTDTSTGHSYELVAASLSWRSARAAAEARTYQGLTGHLATVTSASEQNFIATVAQNTQAWLGALQPAGSVEPGGGFAWITGEPFVYTNWRSGEPNNANPTGIEDTFYYTSNGGTWNDISADVVDSAVQHYLVEYDGTPGGGTTQATATILNDDTPPALSIDDVQIVEGDGTNEAVFTITVTGVSKAAMSVDVTTQDVTAKAGADYQSVTSTLQIPQGQTSIMVSVPISADAIDEMDETFKVNLSNPVNATISDAQGVGTITDDDAPPTLSVDDVSIAEGTGGTTNAVFTITANGATEKTIAVDVITQNGTAVSSADYQNVNRTVQIPVGQSSVMVSVPITTDSLDEANETFTVNLSDPTNATLSDAQGVGTITDDDAAPALIINDVSALEGNSGLSNETFTVTLSAPSGKTVTVKYATSAPGSNAATADVDYVAVPSTTLTFAPGETSKPVTIQVKGDTLREANERFIVRLSSPSNATIADPIGYGTITDDDPSTFNINDFSVAEGNAGTSNATFTVTLSAASTQTVTVHYAAVKGTTNPATVGSDFTSTKGTLTFNAGVVTKMITVPIIGDYRIEADETFFVDLSAPTGSAVIGDGHGVGTITNDDADTTAPTVSFTTSATTPVGTTPVSGSAIYNAVPTISGVAADSDSGVQRVVVRLYRATATAGVYEYWTGSGWTTTVTDLSTVLTPAAGGANVTWKRSSGWPSGADFSDGTYYLRALAFDRAGNSAATLASNFKKLTDTNAPTAAFTTPTSTPSGTTPANGSSYSFSTFPAITGLADDATSGIAKVDLFLYRQVSGTGTTTYEYWDGTTWVQPSGAKPALSTTLSPVAGGAHVTWSRSGGWPSGADFADNVYYLRVFAYDRAGNASGTNNTLTRFQKATVTATASASSSSVTLTFSSTTNASNASGFAVTVNGSPATIQNTQRNGADVTLLLPDGTLQSGDEISVTWNTGTANAVAE